MARWQTGAVNEAPAGPEIAVCSAKGCRDQAQWALAWNNPRLHAPDRRKIWLACGTHRTTLADFLSVRGFLRDVNPLEPEAPPPSGRELS
jgi:hypothetical protein